MSEEGGEHEDKGDEDDKKEDPEEEHVGSGIGWFFLVLVFYCFLRPAAHLKQQDITCFPGVLWFGRLL